MQSGLETKVYITFGGNIYGAKKKKIEADVFSLSLSYIFFPYFMSQVQDRYVQLVKEITALQWVRESLPSHSKYYEGLKKKLEKQQHLKEFSENEL